MAKLTLPIQVGKSYKRRDGQITQATALESNGDTVFMKCAGGDGYLFTATGRADYGERAWPQDLVADHPEIKGHVHAALMVEYAKDAAETDKPWERWQYRRNATTVWYGDLDENPIWDAVVQYRRKPKTININGHEVPEPLRVRPKDDDLVYTVMIDRASDIVYHTKWADIEAHRAWFARGLVHATEDGAYAHAKALLSFTESFNK